MTSTDSLPPTFTRLAWSALVPSLVAPHALAVANGRLELARTVAFAGGPALAGALVGWTGGALAFGAASAVGVTSPPMAWA
jgi:hypothetical protein